MNPGWLLLALAVVAEVTAGIALRSSKGFTMLRPTILAIAAFGTAFYAISVAMQTLPVSVVYPVWAGAGTAGVALIGVAALGESAGARKIFGIVLVVIGIVLINSTSTS